jgi:[histone H3]-lysine9 N-trimethyltransferase SUV39H
VNTIDDEALPQNFRFIQHMEFGPGVEAASAAFLSGCDCVIDSDCQYDTCQCMGEIEKDHEHQEVNAYHVEGDEVGLLRASMLNSTKPLYECHASCKCTSQCPNRVVERGRTVPLQIFRTKDRGWGESFLTFVLHRTLISIRC